MKYRVITTPDGPSAHVYTYGGRHTGGKWFVGFFVADPNVGFRGATTPPGNAGPYDTAIQADAVAERIAQTLRAFAGPDATLTERETPGL